MDVQMMVVDERPPVYDVVVAEHRVTPTRPRRSRRPGSWTFLTVRTLLLVAAMWPRGVSDRLRHRTQPLPARLTLTGGVGLPGWLSLCRRDGSEVAFGAVGKFWQANIEWRDVPPAEFADFNEPGWGTIACYFTVRPYDGDRTLLSYECRTSGRFAWRTTHAAA